MPKFSKPDGIFTEDFLSAAACSANSRHLAKRPARCRKELVSSSSASSLSFISLNLSRKDQEGVYWAKGIQRDPKGLYKIKRPNIEPKSWDILGLYNQGPQFIEPQKGGIGGVFA